jgi:taurine transport system substrate-binding protein
MKKKTLAKIGIFTAAAALAVVSAACGSNDDSSNAGESTGLPEKIVIGYQNIPNGDLVVKHDGLLSGSCSIPVAL